MLADAQWRIEVVGRLLYTQVFIACLAIQALLRLFLAIQALLRLYQGRILLYTQSFVFVNTHTGVRRLFRQHGADPVAVAQGGLPVLSLQSPLRLFSASIKAHSTSIKALFSLY